MVQQLDPPPVTSNQIPLPMRGGTSRITLRHNDPYHDEAIQANDLCAGLVSALERTDKEKRVTFHDCDWLADARNFHEQDMPGNSVIDLEQIRAVLGDIDHQEPLKSTLLSALHRPKHAPSFLSVLIR